MSETAYFAQLSQALHQARIAEPTTIIDRERLQHNIQTMLKTLPQGMGYRLVAKSLPCEQLIREVRAQTKTHRLMVFNLSYLLLLADIMPECSFLLGKPLPHQALAQFLEQQSAPLNIQWLVDDVARLTQYEDRAKQYQQKLQINLELDVGLHRGGFAQTPLLEQALAMINTSAYLSFSGFVGYEPHLGNLPEQDGWRERAKHAAWEIYQNALTIAEQAGYDRNLLTRNAAGSPTYPLYRDTHIANEVSVGSVLVKPTDFDTELLADHLPAAVIATPVLKIASELKVPGLAFASRPTRLNIPQDKKMVFIYGGKWMAQPTFPKGLAYSQIFGRSSNQEMLEADAHLNLQPDDFIFLRPTQSEAILTQFGDIAIYQNHKIQTSWKPFPAMP